MDEGCGHEVAVEAGVVGHVVEVEEVGEILEGEVEVGGVGGVELLAVGTAREEVVALHDVTREALVEVAAVDGALPADACLEGGRGFVGEAEAGCDVEGCGGVSGVGCPAAF